MRAVYDRAGALAPPGPVRRARARPGARAGRWRAVAPAGALERVRGVVHVHSDLTTGDFTLEGLVGLADQQGIGVLLLAENYRSARGLRSAAVPRADAGEPARALGRRRARGLLRPGGRGPAATAARAAHPRGRGDAALSLDRLAGRARPHRAQPPEERPRVRPDRSGRAGRAARRRPAAGRPYTAQSLFDALPVLLLVPGRGAAGSAAVRSGAGWAAAPSSSCVAGRGCAAACCAPWAPSPSCAAGRSRPIRIRRSSDPGLAPYQAADRSRRAARRRRRVVVPGGAWTSASSSRSGAGGLADRALSRRSAEDVSLQRRSARSTRTRATFERPGGGWDRLLRRVRPGRAHAAGVGARRVGLPRPHRGQADGPAADRVPRREKSEAGVLDALRRGRMYAVQRTRELGLRPRRVRGQRGREHGRAGRDAAGAGGDARSSSHVAVEASDGKRHDVRVAVVVNGRRCALEKRRHPDARRCTAR